MLDALERLSPKAMVGASVVVVVIAGVNFILINSLLFPRVRIASRPVRYSPLFPLPLIRHVLLYEIGPLALLYLATTGWPAMLLSWQRRTYVAASDANKCASVPLDTLWRRLTDGRTDGRTRGGGGGWKLYRHHVKL